MFYYLTGKITIADANLVVVDCGGVGYGCHVSSYTLAQLHNGEERRLYTTCNIKEDAFDIYGFLSREEQRLFEQLTGVTGVGPGIALALLSAMTPDQLTLAVLTGDEKSMTAARGIGAKTAKRIILELKDKLGGAQELSAGSTAIPLPKQSGKLSTATAALVELGYTQSEAASALKGADVEALSVEELIRYALRAMVLK